MTSGGSRRFGKLGQFLAKFNTDRRKKANQGRSNSSIASKFSSRFTPEVIREAGVEVW
jgi:hypothetical protein